jgi:hypothetical protein
LYVVLAEREKEHALQVYQAEVLWVIGSSLRTDILLPRFADIIDRKSDTRTGREILDDLKSTLRSRRERRLRA